MISIDIYMHAKLFFVKKGTFQDVFGTERTDIYLHKGDFDLQINHLVAHGCIPDISAIHRWALMPIQRDGIV